MNFSEFKKLLGADPMNRDPETLRARASSPEFEQAAAEAEALEQKIRSAGELPVDERRLLDDILAIPGETRRGPRRWMAIAAGLVIVAGVAGILLFNPFSRPETIEQYVSGHYAHDGDEFLALALEQDGVEPGKISTLLANWDLRLGPELDVRVKYIDRCPTMDGYGAHMIVQSDRGMITLIVMPNTTVEDRELIEFDGMQARLVSLGESSAAIIGRPEQSVSSFEDLVRRSIIKST